jgi:hypothetical protein
MISTESTATPTATLRAVVPRSICVQPASATATHSVSSSDGIVM